MIQVEYEVVEGTEFKGALRLMEAWLDNPCNKTKAAVQEYSMEDWDWSWAWCPMVEDMLDGNTGGIKRMIDIVYFDPYSEDT